LPHRIASSALNRWSHKHWILAGLFAFLGTLLIAIVPGFANAMRQPAVKIGQTTLDLPLPPTDLEAGAAPASGWQFVRVRSGQTLGAIFAEQHLTSALMNRVLAASSSDNALTHLREGQELAFNLDATNQLKAFRFDRDDSNRVEITVDNNQAKETVTPRQIEHRIEVTAGTITSSLYADGARVGLSSAAINEMANVFKYDIDFVEDLRDGDQFQVVYDDIYRDGQRVGNGGIVGATFINRGKRFTAFRFEHNGQIEYFDESGRSLKKTLLRIPIEFARLSSTFGMREHPILGRMRMHKGVDYAAPTGTPIMAAGDARVKFVGWKNGYGRCVELDHGQGRSTFYGHMSAWGKEKVGQSIGQGSIIGYVGMTGLATGPHLHYEFRVNGNQINPLSVTMPKPEPLGGDELMRFRLATAPAMAKMLLIEKNTRVAIR
jgi:murein DD-endopeptidase MepM/ murein hydrolase activator NlpD